MEYSEVKLLLPDRSIGNQFISLNISPYKIQCIPANGS